MNNPIQKGLCLAFGGTNARVGLCEDGQITGFAVNATPPQPDAFFGWIADKILGAAEQDAKWVVIGVPGPVSDIDGKQAVGPLPNVPGLADKAHYLEAELSKARPEVKNLLDQGFVIKAVNDGMLSAFAAASLYGDGDESYRAIASFIIGTGIGGAMVRRQKNGIFRPSESLFEIGHVPLGRSHRDTFESTISGTSLHRRHGMRAEAIPPGHEAWREVGEHIAQMVMIIGIVGGADLVVTCGGVGSNSYEHYRPYLEESLDGFRNSPHPIHRVAIPDVKTVSPEDSQIFELRGAEGVMRHYLSEQA